MWPPNYGVPTESGYAPLAGAPPGVGYGAAPPAPYAYGAQPAFGPPHGAPAPSGPSYTGSFTAPAPAGYGAPSPAGPPPALPGGPPPSSGGSYIAAPGAIAWGQPVPIDPRAASQTQLSSSQAAWGQPGLPDPRAGSQSYQLPPQQSIPPAMPPPGVGSAPLINRKALLVGCSYRGTSSALQGCTNDVQCMQFALKKVTHIISSP